MAAVAVSFDGTRVNDAEALGTVWTDIGGGKAASEPDFVYQNTAAVSEKVGTTEGGVALDTGGTTYDMTTPQVWICKMICTNSAALNNVGPTGAILEIGSGGRRSAYDRYYVVGGDTYRIVGGWLIVPIDPNGGNQSARPGTAPTLSAINYFGLAATFGATSKAENVALDAVDIVPNGSGLTLVGGDGGDADGTFDSFVTYDEGTSTNRYGIVSTQEGILYVTGVLTIGSATATEFTDTGAVIVWPDALFLNSTGFFGLDISLANASTVVTMTGCVFISRGTSGGTVDTRADVVFTGTSGSADLDSCRFVNLRVMTLTSAVTLVACDIQTVSLTQSAAELDGCVIRTGSASGVASITDPTFGASAIHDCDFVQDGAGHAIELSSVGATVTLSNITWSGYGADTTNSAAIYVSAASGTTTINYSGGTAPTYRSAGATVVVQASITITYTGLVAGTEVRVYRVSDGVEIDGIESTAGTSFAAGLQSSVAYNVVVIAKGYIPVRQNNVTYTASISSPINIQADPNYSNP